LNSDQGAKQIQAMPGIRHFCDQSNSLVDRHTLHFLRREVFAYTLIGAESET